MAEDNGDKLDAVGFENAGRGSKLGLVLALGAIAVVGAGITVQQIWQRRLSKPEKARLKFYRYLRERGRLES